MKGVVFTEFIEMVENEFSPDLADTIITEAGLPSGGIYTSVGTYRHEEMLGSSTGLPNTRISLHQIC